MPSNTSRRGSGCVSRPSGRCPCGKALVVTSACRVGMAAGPTGHVFSNARGRLSEWEVGAGAATQLASGPAGASRIQPPAVMVHHHPYAAPWSRRNGEVTSKGVERAEFQREGEPPGRVVLRAGMPAPGAPVPRMSIAAKDNFGSGWLEGNQVCPLRGVGDAAPSCHTGGCRFCAAGAGGLGLRRRTAVPERQGRPAQELFVLDSRVAVFPVPGGGKKFATVPASTRWLSARRPPSRQGGAVKGAGVVVMSSSLIFNRAMNFFLDHTSTNSIFPGASHHPHVFFSSSQSMGPHPSPASGGRSSRCRA